MLSRSGDSTKKESIRHSYTRNDDDDINAINTADSVDPVDFVDNASFAKEALVIDKKLRDL